MSYAPVDHEHDPLELDPIKRDRWGRPLLIPAGGTETDRTAYTRASTLANAISPDYGLTKWKLRRTAKGLCDRPDLTAMGSALPTLTGDRKTDAPTNRELDFLIQEAQMEAGAFEQAHYGTAIHGHTDADGNRGPIPERMQADVDSFHTALVARRLRIVASELFVACDELESAGSFDHVVEHIPTGQYFVLEKKTGDPHMFEWLLQTTVYAHGDLYDPRTDERAPLGVSLKRAIIAHIPQGAGRTDLYPLDLEHGMKRALQAKEIREDQRNDAAIAWRLWEDPE